MATTPRNAAMVAVAKQRLDDTAAMRDRWAVLRRALIKAGKTPGNAQPFWTKQQWQSFLSQQERL